MMARARGAVRWGSKFEAGVVPATIATPATRTNAINTLRMGVFFFLGTPHHQSLTLIQVASRWWLCSLRIFLVDALGFGRPPRRGVPMRMAHSLAQPLELPRLDPRCDEVAEANADPAVGSGIWCRPLLHVDDNANGSPSNLRRLVSIEEADFGADEEDHDERSFQRRDKSLAPDHVPPL
jgi:hypothetical protein